MLKASFFAMSILLHCICVLCHDTKRIESLDKKFKRKIYRVRMNLMDELADREEKIKSDIQLELPSAIEETILDLISSGELDNLLKVRNDFGQDKLQQQIQHLKTVVLGLSRRLAEKDNELMSLNQEIQKLRSEITMIDESSSGNEDNDIRLVRGEMIKLQNDVNIMQDVVSNYDENAITSVHRKVLKLQNYMSVLNETCTKTMDNEVTVIRQEIRKLRHDMTTVNGTTSKTGTCPEEESVIAMKERQPENSINQTILFLGTNGQGFILDPNKKGERRLINVPMTVQAFTVVKDKTSLTLVASGGNSLLKKMRFLTGQGSLELEENIDFEPSPGGSCYSMAYDEIKKSFFFGVTTFESKHEIKRTISNTIYKIADVSSYGHTAYSLAVDPLKEVLFSCHFTKLVRLSYNGRSEKVIAFGRFLLGVTLSPSGDYVYFSDGGAIMRVSPDGGDKRLMNTLKPRVNIRSIVLVGDKIYVGDFSGEIMVYDLKLNDSETLGSLPTTYVVLNYIA